MCLFAVWGNVTRNADVLAISYAAVRLMHNHTARAHDEDDDDDDDVIWEACRAWRRCFPAEFLLRGFLGFPKDHPTISPPKPEQVSREDLDQESMHDTITHYNTTFHMHQQDAYASVYKLIYTAHI